MLQNAIRNLKNQEGEGEGGFTLIELLVVILIIGILAAIALPTFLGQSDKAKDSSSKSDARNAVTQIESCLADGGTTAEVTKCKTRSVAFDAATDNPDLKQFSNLVSAPGASGTEYVVTATQPDTTHVFKIAKNAPGGYTRTCSTLGQGGCTSSWGTAIVAP